MSTIHLIRHGQASFGSDNYDKLSPTGIRQAAVLAEHWNRLRQQPNVIICGEMQRQLGSAISFIDRYTDYGITLSDPQSDPGLNEYNYLDLIDQQLIRLAKNQSSKTVDKQQLFKDKKIFHRFLEQTLQDWINGKLIQGTDESWTDFSERCWAVVERIQTKLGRGKIVAVFTSAGVIGAILSRLLHLDPLKAVQLKLGLYNCSVTSILYNDKQISLSSFNNIGHLECKDEQLLITFL